MTLSEKISEMLNYQPEEKKESGDIYKAIEILNKTREVNKSNSNRDALGRFTFGKVKLAVNGKPTGNTSGNKSNVNKTALRVSLANKNSHVITGITPLKLTKVNYVTEVDKAYKNLIANMNTGYDCPCLGLKVNHFNKFHEIEQNGRPRKFSDIVDHASYIPFIPEVLKNGLTDPALDESKKNGICHNVVGKAEIIENGKIVRIGIVVTVIDERMNKGKVEKLSVFKIGVKNGIIKSYRTVVPDVQWLNSAHGYDSIYSKHTVSIPQSINKSIDSQKKNKKITTTKRLLKPIPSTKCAGEEFYFKAHRELNEKYVEYYDDLTSRIYDYLCDQLDLPKCNVITKAIARYKGQILYTPETGKPIDEKELQKLVEGLTRLLNQNRKVGENMIKESQVLGKIIEKLLAGKKLRELKNIPLEELKVSNKTYSTILNDPDKYLNTWDKINYKLMRQSACERLQNMDDNIKHQVKQILFDGVVARESKSKISQRLFDKLGAENRNWRRIVDTEINNNLNRSYIEAVTSQAAEGEKVYFQRLEVVDSRTCEFCREKNGEVVLFSNTPLEDDKINDTYARKAIWSGKTWTGENNTLAEGIFHPNCRGVWVKWNPSFNMEL